MNFKELFLTKNNCYIAGKKITPAGIMVHSTGVNNPDLKRYVGPDDGFLGVNGNNNHWNQEKPDGREVCVHAFIGKLADGAIATYQTLPWNTRGWHAGGKANDTYIGFEICEDNTQDAEYFGKVYREAVELCAMLCREYGIKPEKPGLICHSEGSALGIASAHADVMHWFPKHGKNMDDFRADVKKAIQETEANTGAPTAVDPAPPPIAETGVDAAKQMQEKPDTESRRDDVFPAPDHETVTYVKPAIKNEKKYQLYLPRRCANFFVRVINNLRNIRV